MAAEKLITDEDLKDLRNQVVMAKAILTQELDPVIRENIQRYTGEFCPNRFNGDIDIVLNEVYPIVQYYMPAIFFRNPRIFLKPRNKYFFVSKRDPLSGEMKKIQMDSMRSAKTQEAILNYGLDEIGYKKETRKVLFDSLIAPYGILWHGYKGNFGMTEESSMYIKKDRIFVKRISPMRFIWDPAVNLSNIEEGRWVGRIIDIPLKDLIEDDKFDVDKKLVKGFKGYGEQIGTENVNKMLQTGAVDYIRINPGRRSMLEFTDKGYQNSERAKFVQVAEIYLRPSRKDERDGKRGTILVLTDEQEKPLRASEWKIKAEGFPSQLLQFNELPDAIFGLSDIETYKQIQDQKNVVINLQLRNAQENSRVIMGLSKEGATEEDIEHVRMGEQSIITFESGDPKDRMFVSTPGGSASNELYMLDTRIQKNLEDKSGVSDLKRGFLQSGEESATSVKIRNAGGSTRPAYRQDIMTEFLKLSFKYLNQLNKQFIPYDEAVRLTGTLDIEWSENLSEEEIQADVDVEIDAISMLPEDPQKEMQELQTVLSFMVQAITNPAITQKMQQEGKTFNLTPVVEQMLLRLKMKDPTIFRNIKPEESQGFASVQQLRAAKDNVKAALYGKQIPNAPKPTDDARAHLEIYTEIQQILQAAGKQSEQLNNLVQIYNQLLQQAQEKEGQAGQQVPKLEKGFVKQMGT